MKTGVVLTLAFALACGTAAAQQLAPEQAAAALLGQQYGLCLQEKGGVQHQLQDARGELAQAMARIKDLEAKLAASSGTSRPDPK